MMRASFLFLALLFVACSPARVTPPGSGGDSPDQGGMDAGPSHQGGTVGAPCTSSGQCSSGQCLADYPDGYCTTSCPFGTCPPGSFCGDTGDGATGCFAACTTSADCRTGYVCGRPLAVCVPRCDRDSDCESGLCNSTSHQCLPRGVGSPCDSDSDCPESYCLRAADGYPGGYCSSTCMRAADCGTGIACLPDLSGDSFCRKPCESSSECRDGYQCAAFAGVSYCAPMCRSSADCVNPSEICDTSSGQCHTFGGHSFPAAFPYPPQVETKGGPILSRPKIVPVFFAGDTASYATTVMNFLGRLGASEYWAGLSEYGIGALTVASKVTLSETPAASIQNSTIGAWLQARIASHDLPTPDSQTLYLVHYPRAVTVTTGSGSSTETSCVNFLGYHSSARITVGSSQMYVPYAIIPRCSSRWQTIEQLLTSVDSHEIVEAATDPILSNMAYYEVDAAHGYLSTVLHGSEIGDMCTQFFSSWITPSDLQSMVQAYWSNRAAVAGHNPCVPASTDGYFSAVADLPDNVQIEGTNTRGVNVTVGHSKTITVNLYSDKQMDPWMVTAQDFSSYQGQASTMDLKLDGIGGANGDELHLTITPRQATGWGYDFFVITSTSGGQQYQTYGVVKE